LHVGQGFVPAETLGLISETFLYDKGIIEAGSVARRALKKTGSSGDRLMRWLCRFPIRTLMSWPANSA